MKGGYGVRHGARQAEAAAAKLQREFKAEVVKKVLSNGKTVGQVARELDLTETAVRHWVKRAEVDRGKGPPGALTSAEKEELAQLRKEVRELREDREILRKAAAFFAKHQK